MVSPIYYVCQARESAESSPTEIKAVVIDSYADPNGVWSDNKILAEIKNLKRKIKLL